MDRYFYSVEMDGDHKVVHMSGNVYLNDEDTTESCYRYAEWTGLCLTIEEVQSLFEKLCFYDYIYERIAYVDNLTQDEMIDTCRTYFNGASGEILHIAQVNEDTSCGDYWFEL